MDDYQDYENDMANHHNMYGIKPWEDEDMEALDRVVGRGHNAGAVDDDHTEQRRRNLLHPWILGNHRKELRVRILKYLEDLKILESDLEDFDRKQRARAWRSSSAVGRENQITGLLARVKREDIVIKIEDDEDVDMERLREMRETELNSYGIKPSDDGGEGALATPIQAQRIKRKKKGRTPKNTTIKREDGGRHTEAGESSRTQKLNVRRQRAQAQGRGSGVD